MSRIIEGRAEAARRLSRRRFIVTSAAVVGLAGGQALLQACTPAPAAAPTSPPAAKPAEASKPAEAVKPAATTAPAPAVAAPTAAVPVKPTQAAPAAVQPRGTFTFASDRQAPSLDPIFIGSEPVRALSLAMCEPLIALENPESPRFVPGLAKSWSTSADGKTWTVKLQENVKFHDGTPLDAAAVKYTFDRWRDPKVAATSAPTRVQVLDRIDMVDPLTVNFVTKAPYAEFLLALVEPAGGIVSPTAAQKGAVADFGRAPVGTGPYKFGGLEGTDAAYIVANPDYWGPNKPKLEKIVLKRIPEAAAIAAGLEAGEIDYSNTIPPALYARLQGNSRLKVTPTADTRVQYMGVLTTKKPFDDVRVRKALMYAVDRDTIIKTILRGLAVPQTSPFWPGQQYRVEQQPPYTFDQAKAKQLLAEAGYGQGFKATILFSNATPQAEVCQAYAECLSQVGIQCELQQREDAVVAQLVRAKDDVRDIWFTNRSVIGVDYQVSRLYSSELLDEENRDRWVHPRAEELVQKGRTTFDEAERAKIYGELQQLVWENVPELFGWHPQTILAMNTKVEGLEYQPFPVTVLRNVGKAS